jgi:hypothetical protein
MLNAEIYAEVIDRHVELAGDLVSFRMPGRPIKSCPRVSDLASGTLVSMLRISSSAGVPPRGTRVGRRLGRRSFGSLDTGLYEANHLVHELE